MLSLERLEDRRLLTAMPTLTSLGVSAVSLVYGHTETLTATVTVAPPNTGTPSGTVTFMDGATALGSPVALNSSGVATLQVSTLPVGLDVLTAGYGGNSNYAASTTAAGPNSIITTVAPAEPTDVAVDAAGNLFIADGGANLAQEVIKATGNIITVAGNGSSGYSGDGGPATAASLTPCSIALDAAGDLFIADIFNNRIREVVKATGDIITVAGGGNNIVGNGIPATAAFIAAPYCVAVDAMGNLFITSSIAGLAREVVKSTGDIITVAGDGTQGSGGDGGPAAWAQLCFPEGVAVDAAGDLFIADSGNERVREVVAATGDIITVAGTDSAGYSGDDGPATAAELGFPEGVAVDSAGDFFISDHVDQRIREVAAGALVTITPAATNVSVTTVAMVLGDPTDALVAHVASPTAVVGSGTVTFVVRGSFGQQVLSGSAPVVSGTATLAWVPQFGGTYTVAVSYADSSGNFTAANNGAGGQTVTVSLNPAFALAPASGTYIVGQCVHIGWTSAVLGSHATTISLAYDPVLPPSTGFDHTEQWIEGDGVTAADGTGSYGWSTAAVAPGTYYLAGYMYDTVTGDAIYSHLTRPIVITATPAFTLTGPCAETCIAGQCVTIQWTSAIATGHSGSINLAYAPNATAWSPNAAWMYNVATAGNGTATYVWNTTGVAAGTYYLSGYLWDATAGQPLFSELSTSIVVT
jgi:sugar lactone lactonase YvrE